MKNFWVARTHWAVFLSLLFSHLSSTAAPKQLCGVSVVKVFETPDEVLLRVSVQSFEPTPYVIWSKDQSGEGAYYSATSALAKAKHCEGISWVVVSRIKPNGEDRMIEKIIVQIGATNAHTLGTHVRTLPKEPSPIVIHERAQLRKLDLPLHETIEVLRSEDLRVLLRVGETPPANRATAQE